MTMTMQEPGGSRDPKQADLFGAPPAREGPKPPALFAIPAASTPRRCALCPAMIYAVPSTKHPGTTIPVRVGPVVRYQGHEIPMPDAVAPTATTAGYGWSHFVDCPHADDFRRDRGR